MGPACNAHPLNCSSQPNNNSTEMAAVNFDNFAEKSRVVLLTGNNYILWQARMKTVLMGPQDWTIDARTEVAPVNSEPDVELAFIHRSQNEHSTIAMEKDDDFLSAAMDTDDPHECLEDLAARYDTVSAISVDSLVAQYLTISMK